MPTLTRPDGTTVEAEYLTVEFPDGSRVTASSQEFGITQDGRSVSIPCGLKFLTEIFSSGKKLDEAIYAVLSSPEWQELARVAIEYCLQFRGGEFLMQLEGQIIDR